MELYSSPPSLLWVVFVKSLALVNCEWEIHFLLYEGIEVYEDNVAVILYSPGKELYLVKV